ncbi:MAG TPA: phytoene/squalene synthase family protein [Spirochaetota bacterium]|nr:phytoene/squalene synthase family protein [Spirochaetota bacterium]HOR43671.1 phytoene/squalene synthase family protein [Spirochaetota bacterium]HOU84928.1 phytoene/squalene synthase family protein [Spirochaetota bacterium]HPK55194.1 phytoene/squalene synthase family protein [Spirochaetota bacterium]HQE58512.1 phytoene/squalene synthase family protein [Spirochaetota bacterium]
MSDNVKIFRKGSKTYFTASLFFPSEVRRDVFSLYAFVRTADDFVDSVPQRKNEFYEFKKLYLESLKKGKKSGNDIIDNFIDLFYRKKFKAEWVSAFLESMELDLTKKRYKSIDETLHYIFGSAEVIGLFMARILDLPKKADKHAQMLGRAMQMINFIRDIAEDNSFGRSYLPLNGKMKSLDYSFSFSNKDMFDAFIRRNSLLYKKWQKSAEEGYQYIPKRYLVPIKTAADMYLWTASQIEKNPMIVYEKKVKPSRFRILKTLIANEVKCFRTLTKEKL